MDEVTTETTEATETTEQPTGWLEAHADLEGFHRETLAKFKSEGEALKGYVELEKSMGSRVKIPEADDTEGWNSFYSKTGRPDAPEAYVTNLPEGQELDAGYESAMKQAAFASGWNQRQWEAAVAANTRYVAESNKKMQEANTTLNTARFEALGWDDKTKAENIELTRRAIAEFEDKAVSGEDDVRLADLLTPEQIKGDPKLVSLISSLYRKSMDDQGLVRGTAPAATGYVPQYKSPSMYDGGDDPESKKARDYFRSQGHVYARQD